MIALNCEFCGISASLKCSGCKNVVYCGKEHQKLHWKKGHKARCKCYELSVNAAIGRHLKATRDIKQGDIIIHEQPLVFGPKIVSAPICLGCNRLLGKDHLIPPQLNKKAKIRIPANYYKCSKCKWPLCGPKCENSQFHVDECSLMADKKFQCNIDYDEENQDENKKESAYCAVVPLRCLLLKKINPKGFQKFVDLEDHLNERLNSNMYNILKLNLLTFFKTILGLDEFDELTIMRTAAILDTNTFEIRLTNLKSKIRAVFPNAAMITHDCVPNTKHIFDKNLNIIVVAAVDIKKDEIITASYGQPLQCTMQRLIHLKGSKCFDCICRRCSDPTELGTFIGSIVCEKCKQGKVISVQPLNNQAIWKCDICRNEIEADHMREIQTFLQQEIESLPKRSPIELELFLKKYCCDSNDDSNKDVDDNAKYLLHAKNTFVLQVKYALTQLYGNVENFLLHDLSDGDLERKIALCNELLEIADLFEPGWSLFRGRLLLSYGEALEVHTDRKLTSGVIGMEQAQQQYQVVSSLLRESYNILHLEAGMNTVLEDVIQKLASKIIS